MKKQLEVAAKLYARTNNRMIPLSDSDEEIMLTVKLEKAFLCGAYYALSKECNNEGLNGNWVINDKKE